MSLILVAYAVCHNLGRDHLIGGLCSMSLILVAYAVSTFHFIGDSPMQYVINIGDSPLPVISGH